MSGRAALVVCAGLKGGGGKTTLALGLFGAFAESGARVALIDADPAGTAAAWCARAAAGSAGRHRPLSGRSDLAAWVAALRAEGEAAEILLLDLPPRDPLPLVAAALLADLVLVPVAPSALELPGAEASLALVRRVRRERADGGPEILLVPNRVSEFHPEARGFEARLAPLGVPLAPVLRLRETHERAYAEGRTVAAMAPGSPAHRELSAIARAVRARLGAAADAAPGPEERATETSGAPVVRAGYLDRPPGAEGRLDLSGYRRRWWHRLLPRVAAHEPRRG
ncbi:MAG: AAA family ATPase [Geminicoccaceae bacterium]|nr:AAA family ATPase [Geminicoccaceae bacterium]MDW8341925.1 AAA family ATPase [Geminicoccaceae bacterium]